MKKVFSITSLVFSLFWSLAMAQESVDVKVFAGIAENKKTHQKIVSQCRAENDCSAFYFYLTNEENGKTKFTRLNESEIYPSNLGGESNTEVLPDIDYGNYASETNGWLFNFTSESWGILTEANGTAQEIAMGFGFLALCPIIFSADIVTTIAVDTASVVSFPIRKLINKLKEKKEMRFKKALIVSPDSESIPKLNNRKFKKLVKKIQTHSL